MAGLSNKTGLTLPAFMSLSRKCPPLLPGKQPALKMGGPWLESRSLSSGSDSDTHSVCTLTLGSLLVHTGGSDGSKFSGFSTNKFFTRYLLCARHWRHDKRKDSGLAPVGLGSLIRRDM